MYNPYTNFTNNDRSKDPKIYNRQYNYQQPNNQVINSRVVGSVPIGVPALGISNNTVYPQQYSQQYAQTSQQQAANTSPQHQHLQYQNPQQYQQYQNVYDTGVHYYQQFQQPQQASQNQYKMAQYAAQLTPQYPNIAQMMHQQVPQQQALHKRQYSQQQLAQQLSQQYYQQLQQQQQQYYQQYQQSQQTAQPQDSSQAAQAQQAQQASATPAIQAAQLGQPQLQSQQLQQNPQLQAAAIGQTQLQNQDEIQHAPEIQQQSQHQLDQAVDESQAAQESPQTRRRGRQPKRAKGAPGQEHSLQQDVQSNNYAPYGDNEQSHVFTEELKAQDPSAPVKRKRGRPRKLLLDPSTNEYIDSNHPNFKQLNKLMKQANSPGSLSDFLSEGATSNGHGKFSTNIRQLDDLEVQQLIQRKDKRGRPRKFPIEETGITVKGIRVGGISKYKKKNKASPSSDNNSVVKRPRGRPRKSVMNDNSEF